MNNVEQLIERKQNKAEKVLNPVFDEVWGKVTDVMAESPALYPNVVITWSSIEPLQLKLESNKKVMLLSVKEIELSTKDIVAYAIDTKSADSFKNFSIELNTSVNKHYNDANNKMEITEVVVTSKISLKTLF